MKLNEIDQNIKYQGYLWPSNENEPIVCDGQKSLKDEIIEYYSAKDRVKYDIINSQNPFVVEGFLWANNTSVSIKFSDGKYIIKPYNDVCKEKANGDNILLKEFCSHRMGDRKLKFLQYWKTRKDEAGNEIGDKETEGMPVLEPAELVFVGF